MTREVAGLKRKLANMRLEEDVAGDLQGLALRRILVTPLTSHSASILSRPLALTARTVI